MALINDMMNAAMEEGYLDENAEAYVCQNAPTFRPKILASLGIEKANNGKRVRQPEDIKTP